MTPACEVTVMRSVEAHAYGGEQGSASVRLTASPSTASEPDDRLLVTLWAQSRGQDEGIEMTPGEIVAMADAWAAVVEAGRREGLLP